MKNRWLMQNVYIFIIRYIVNAEKITKYINNLFVYFYIPSNTGFQIVMLILFSKFFRINLKSIPGS